MFSPAGTRILSGSWDGTAKLWDIASGELLRTFFWNASHIRAVGWSPDGNTVAVGGDPSEWPFTEAELGKIQTAFDNRDWSQFQMPEVENEPTNEVRLFDVQSGSLLRIIRDTSWGLAFSPHGQSLAVLSWEGLSIHALSDGRELANNKVKMDLRNVLYSEDGKQVACVGGDGVCVFDAHSAELQFIATDPNLFPGHKLEEATYSIVRLPDALDHVEPEDEPAYITQFWRELLPGFLASSLSDQGMGCQRIAFSPDHKRVAILRADPAYCSKNFVIHPAGIIIFNVESQELEWLLHYPKQKWLRTLSFSPDGRLLAAAGDAQQISLWDLNTGREVSQLGNPPAKITSVAFSPSEPYLAAADAAGTLVLCDTRDSNLVAVDESWNSPIVHVEFSPTADALLLASSNGKIRIVDVPALQTVVEFQAHQGRFLGGTFSENGEKYLSVGHTRNSADPDDPNQNSEAILWSLSTNRKLNELRFPEGFHVRSVAASPDKKWLAIAAADEVLMGDISSRLNFRKVYQDKKNGIREVAFTPDGSHLVGYEGYGMRIMNFSEKTATKWFIATRDEPTSFAVSGDGKSLFRATAYHREIEGFDRITSKLKQRFLGHQNSVNSVAVSPDSQLLASGGDDGTLKLWNIESREMISSIVLVSTSSDHQRQWQCLKS